eukprot:6458319-Amphidinium_carterae.1
MLPSDKTHMLCCDNINCLGAVREQVFAWQGGAFTFAGCTAIPACTLPADTTGYTPSNCGSTSTEAYVPQDDSSWNHCRHDFGISGLQSRPSRIS